MKMFHLKLNRDHGPQEHRTRQSEKSIFSDTYRTASKVTTDGCLGLRETTYLSSEIPWMHIETRRNISIVLSSWLIEPTSRVCSRNWPVRAEWAPICNFRGPFFQERGPQKIFELLCTVYSEGTQESVEYEHRELRQ